MLADLQAWLARGDDDRAQLAGDLLHDLGDGRIKLYLIYQALNFRRAHGDLFTHGAYLPLEAAGAKREHVCAFARCFRDEAVLVVAPRLVVRLADGVERPPLGPEVWGKTQLLLPAALAGRSYRNVFTGEVLAPGDHDGTPGPLLASVLGRFPVALLQCCEPGLR